MKKNNIIILLLLLFLFGCGTDTGNPTLTNTLPVSSTSPYTDQIAYHLCSKIRECFTPVLTNCEVKIRSATLIPTNLGLNETTYSNLDVIQTAISATTLQIDLIKSNACFQSLANLSCTSSQVTQSYNSSSLEDLTQAWKLLTVDSSCSQTLY